MRIKLTDVAEVVSGATPSTNHPEYYDGTVVWATPKDLSDQHTKYFTKGERNITEQGFKSCSASMIPAENILMSSRAPIGLLAINTVPCCTNQGFKSLILDHSKCDTDYMYYYLQYHIQEIEALAGGTTFKEVAKASLEKLEIELPSLDVQRTIGQVLSSLDSKILNNNAISSQLESLAKTIYDYWFLQFDFPDENGRPYKSSGGKMVWNEELKREIPEGWKVLKMSEFLDVLKDGTHNPPKRVAQGVPLLTGQMFGQDFLNYSKSTNISQKDYEAIHLTYQPRKGDVILTKIGTIGNVNILRDEDIPIAIHCNSALLRYKKGYDGPFGYFMTKSKLFLARLKSVKGQSIQEFVSLDRIGSILMEQPPYKRC